VQARSLVEPLRKIIARLEGHFVQGKATDLVMSERLLEVEITAENGGKERIYVPLAFLRPLRDLENSFSADMTS
jgi:hypothetical protein